MTIGERIKKTRKDAHLTQKQLANKLNVSYVNIAQWENGRRNPKIETLQNLAKALNVSIGYLQGYEEIDAHQIVTFLKNRDYEAVANFIDVPENTIFRLSDEDYRELQNITKDTLNNADLEINEIDSLLNENKAQINIISSLICLRVNETVAHNLIEFFLKLNANGQEIAVERVEELTKIPDYQKDKTPYPFFHAEVCTCSSFSTMISGALPLFFHAVRPVPL